MKTLYKLKQKSVTPVDFYVVDVETKIEKNGRDYWGLSARPESFVFGMVYGHNYVKRFDTVGDLRAEFETERYKDKIVFAHNAEYDFTTLFDNIYLFDSKAIFNGKLISFTNGNCIFADSMNIYGFAVKKLGELLGLEKGTVLEEGMNEPIEYPLDPKWIDYCTRDCRIVYDALLEFFAMIGDIKITQASLSMAYFRSNHLDHHIKFDDRLQKYFFNSYYGGRTEAFKIGPTNSCVYDVNSMYPHMMVHTKFPSPSKLRRSSRITVDELKSRIKFNEGCCKIKVHHKDHFFGFLPYRFDKKLVFPVGTFTTWVNFNELRFALEHDVIEILEVHEAIYSRPSKSPFVSFVNELHKKKRESENPLRITMYKLLMNSLYGKFAQRIVEEYEYIRDSINHGGAILEAIKKNVFIKLNIFSEKRNDCFLVTKSDKEMADWSIPSYASYITSEARIMLLKFLLENQHNGVTYCDTDSCFMEVDPNLPFTKKLGEWCPEDKIVTFIAGLKNYSYNNKDGSEGRKLKGVPKSAKEIAKDTYEFFNLVKTKESLVRNLKPGVLTRRVKIISNKYTKREVSPDGTTKPIKLV